MAAEVGTDVNRAVEILRSGGLVAIPTETVYGLAASALDSTAVARVFEAKNRPRFDPLIVHIADREKLTELVTDTPPVAKSLAGQFWPGPLTLVLPKQDAVSDLVTAGLPRVAVRVPDHPLTLELLTRTNLPLAAPSANPFGAISPTCADHVAAQLGDRVDYILDGGPCRVGIESTVVAIEEDELIILRPGGVTRERLSEVTDLPISESRGVADRPSAPGQLSRHYAPRTRLEITTSPVGSTSQRIGLLALSPISACAGFAEVEVLSTTGDLVEAAAGFFAALRRLDAANLDLILALPFVEEGLGRALNDRLRRASAASDL